MVGFQELAVFPNKFSRVGHEFGDFLKDAAEVTVFNSMSRTSAEKLGFTRGSWNLK